MNSDPVLKIPGSPLRILGIDPGLNITGYGVLEIVGKRHQLVEAGVVRGRARGTLAERVHDIHTGVTDVIQALKPDVMALEKLYLRIWISRID